MTSLLPGLFAPRAGQHFRDEQRRRRSQYDRGTRLAEIEDSYEVESHGNSTFHQYINGPPDSLQALAMTQIRNY